MLRLTRKQITDLDCKVIRIDRLLNVRDVLMEAGYKFAEYTDGDHNHYDVFKVPCTDEYVIFDYSLRQGEPVGRPINEVAKAKLLDLDGWSKMELEEYRSHIDEDEVQDVLTLTLECFRDIISEH